LIARTTQQPFSELSQEFSTPGGLNEQMTGDLNEKGVFAAQARALDRILERIRKC
jgi:pyrroline-5-carboxylate reductase